MMELISQHQQQGSSPHRSQSFRHHRTSRHTQFEGGQGTITPKYSQEDTTNGERRRSTPSVARRASLGQKKLESSQRIDTWPEPKPPSEILANFLRLPDSEDYQRVRQFKIDEKGVVVSRGDSFRRKKNILPGIQGEDVALSSPRARNDLSRSPLSNRMQLSESTIARDVVVSSPKRIDSVAPRSISISSSDSTSGAGATMPIVTLANGVVPSIAVANEGGELESGYMDDACTSSQRLNHYKICVLGSPGTGKTSLINQFITSDYKNTFADDNNDIDDDAAVLKEKTVSVSIGGHECAFLTFHEPSDSWKDEENVSAYLLVYSIDKKSSFRAAIRTLEDIRAEKITAIPIILVGNKIDLERKRAVSKQDIKAVTFTYSVANFEVSVALNVDVDELLIGIIAQVKDAFLSNENNEGSQIVHPNLTRASSHHRICGNERTSDDFHAAIRRYSQRKKRQMGLVSDLDNECRCSNLNPSALLERFRQWKKSSSKC